MRNSPLVTTDGGSSRRADSISALRAQVSGQRELQGRLGSTPACKELRWRGRNEVLVGLIEGVRVADDLEPVPEAWGACQRERAVKVPVRADSASGCLNEEDVRCVVVTRRDAEHGRGPGQSQVRRRRLQKRAMEIQLDPIRGDGRG